MGTKNLATAELPTNVRYTHILCIYERESRYKYKDPLDGSRERTASSTFKGRGKIPFFLYQRVCLERQKHIENRCANDIGANINQLAKHINTLPSDENILYSLDRINQYLSDVETINRKLL